LSHELNNPASAAARSAQQLGTVLSEMDSAVSILAGARLTDDQRLLIKSLRDRVASDRALTPLERADREDELCTWLDQHHADDNAAAALAQTGVSRDMLEELARGLPDDVFDAAVRWIATGYTARGLAADVERATRRIHDLVSAVKRFTHMDRASVAEPSSIAQPLADTVAVLAAKARAKSAMVTLDVPGDLPPVKMYGGELNQVWSNLLENALDSIGEHGQVAISARAEAPGNVVVRIVDDGPGIPAENMKRIFDPFFTTKPIGQGTGLGLDIARRIVRRHDGDIAVDSRPGGGRTEFRVTLPAS
jgi:signal transduction histidine kinase